MMPALALAFPAFDPVLIEIGPFAIRWYALAYIAGLLGGAWLARRLVATPHLWAGGTPPFLVSAIDDVLLWVTVGIVLGGRLGFVLFYEPSYFLQHPLEALKIWQGGMAFHGGLLGALTALVLYARRHKIPLLSLLDVSSAVAPMGLLLGRIANFINGELWGKPTDVPWGMVFPRAGPEPRHPSQLYEAALEGLLLLLVVQWMARHGALKRPGLVTGVFAVGYFLTRAVGEIFRAQDGEVTFFGGTLTMGTLLSIPLLLAGSALLVRARR